MAKGFLKLKIDHRKLCTGIFCCGIAITVGMGISAYEQMELENGCELKRKEAGQEDYKEELFAYVDEKKIPVSVTVGARKLTKEEAEKELGRAAELLDDVLKGENESFSNVTTNLNFVDAVEGTLVEVEWTEKLSEYFQSNGTLREEIEISEPIEQKVSAILSCQEFVRDYEKIIILMPRKMEVQKALSEMVLKSEQENRESDLLILPAQYNGNTIVWKRPLDITFLYFFGFTIIAVVFLTFGKKRDEKQKKREMMEELEKEYASVVSKFTMLLAAGLSVKNAWERIVLLGKKDQCGTKFVYEEMGWAVKQMQKGISELEIYEAFGNRVGLVHYKKLMALFVSYKKRGSINLVDAMNQEMLQAWEEQKRKTRQQGEQIGTKLLLPMMGMLSVVFVMILIPAFLSFGL